MNSSVVTLSVQ